jgi:hypothetical protein
MLAVATYDGISSQLNLPKISSIWGASYQLLPAWGWVALGQSLLTAWLIYRVREQAGLHGPIAPISTTKNFEQFEKRLATAQDHVGELLHWKDSIAATSDPTSRIEAAVSDLASEMTDSKKRMDDLEAKIDHNCRVIDDSGAAILRLEDLGRHYEYSMRAIIRAFLPIDAGTVLRNIKARLDYLSTSVYKGDFGEKLDTSFEPLVFHSDEFDALCKVAGDVVAAVPDMRQRLDIPSDAGRSLFIPQDEGYLVLSGDSPARKRGYQAAQRRYIHFQISEFLRTGRGQ